MEIIFSSTYLIYTTYTTQYTKNNITYNTKHHYNVNIAIILLYIILRRAGK